MKQHNKKTTKQLLKDAQTYLSWDYDRMSANGKEAYKLLTIANQRLEKGKLCQTGVETKSN